MNAANQRQLTPVLAVIAVLLGALLLLLLTGVGSHARWDTPRPRAPLPAAGSPADQPQPQPLQQFALVWQKPLFSADRKPTVRVADGGSSLGDLELTGIILTADVRMAFLHDKRDGRQIHLHEGESLPDGSVKLVEVRPRSALFDSSSGRTELKLPAGAPIDVPKAGAPADADGGNQPGAAMMNITPGGDGRPTNMPVQPPPENHSPSAVERLRQNIQKRRAAAAAAANEGVH